MRLRSFTFSELIEFGVCSKLAYILKNPSSYDKDLDSLIGETDWDYFIPGNVKNVVPLWDNNADTIARWDRAGKIEYVCLLHDDPNWILEASSEQGIKAQLWTN